MGTTLVTGASGFVGSHLMKEMERRGLTAKGVTRQARAGLVTIPSYGADMDWRDHLAGVDAVLHLAARVHVMRETAEDPLASFRKANVDATVNLAQQAAEAGARRFVFVSSIKVNGERTEPGKPFTAGDPPDPQDPYALSKAEAEAALMALGRQSGMEIVVIRPPLVYGPGVAGNFRSLMKWAASGAPSIFPAVRNKRSLIYVRNLCDLLITVLDHPNAANEVFLASDGHDCSTHELLSALAAAFGKKPGSIPVPLPILHAVGRITGRNQAMERLLGSLEVDTSKTCDTLSWTPPVTCMAGLSATARGTPQNPSNVA
jgi:nucleoside-diphosphate-sugar epimerase